MNVKYKIFQSSTKSWQTLFDEAAAFASERGREQLFTFRILKLESEA